MERKGAKEPARSGHGKDDKPRIIIKKTKGHGGGHHGGDHEILLDSGKLRRDGGPPRRFTAPA